MSYLTLYKLYRLKHQRYFPTCLEERKGIAAYNLGPYNSGDTVYQFPNVEVGGTRILPDGALFVALERMGQYCSFNDSVYKVLSGDQVGYISISNGLSASRGEVQKL